MAKASKLLFHKAPLKIISEFCRTKKGTLKKTNSPLDNLTAKLSNHTGKFIMDFDSVFNSKLDVGKDHKKVRFFQKSTAIVCEDFYIFHHNSYSRFKCSINSFYTDGYSKKKRFYYRLIIPINDNFNFHYQIDDMVIDSDMGYSSRSATKAIISDVELVGYIIHDDSKNNYFVIESESLQTYKEFSDKAYAFRNAVGYLTGHLYGGNCYYFAYTKKAMETPVHYYFNTSRPTIISYYKPLHSNPYSYLRGQKTADSYYKKKILKTINITQLSNLSQKLHDSIEFTSVILLIIESSVSSLLFMPGGYSIALEALTTLIIDKEKFELAPIKDKKVAALIRKECKVIIKTHCEGNIPPEDLNTLNIRIGDINKPTNKLKLQAPFEKLGIVLEQADLDLIKTRNDFLHGRIPDISKMGEGRSIKEKEKDLYYASIRFYTLLNVLILKWIGFDNYIINHPRLIKNPMKIMLKEKHYRKI